MPRSLGGNLVIYNISWHVIRPFEVSFSSLSHAVSLRFVFPPRMYPRERRCLVSVFKDHCGFYRRMPKNQYLPGKNGSRFLASFCYSFFVPQQRCFPCSEFVHRHLWIRWSSPPSRHYHGSGYLTVPVHQRSSPSSHATLRFPLNAHT